MTAPSASETATSSRTFHGAGSMAITRISSVGATLVAKSTAPQAASTSSDHQPPRAPSAAIPLSASPPPEGPASWAAPTETPIATGTPSTTTLPRISERACPRDLAEQPERRGREREAQAHLLDRLDAHLGPAAVLAQAGVAVVAEEEEEAGGQVGEEAERPGEEPAHQTSMV